MPNKATAEARAVALAFLDRRTDSEIDVLWEAAKSESAAKAMAMWMQAQEFVLPKLARVEKGISDATDEELLAEIRRRKAEAQEPQE